MTEKQGMGWCRSKNKILSMSWCSRSGDKSVRRGQILLLFLVYLKILQTILPLFLVHYHPNKKIGLLLVFQ